MTTDAIPADIAADLDALADAPAVDDRCAVDRWTNTDHDDKRARRVDLVARVLTAAAELCAADETLAAALDEIADEHRYLSRVWDGATSAADYYRTNADDYHAQALDARRRSEAAARALVTPEQTDTARRNLIHDMQAAEHEAGARASVSNAYRNAARVISDALNG